MNERTKILVALGVGIVGTFAAVLAAAAYAVWDTPLVQGGK